ncbi:LuxS/MPP-like metallohydrolase [Epithele typhae]|uniref:LuxS/MPP-like metallohydrolase n=1 Tax=Epithele typhae TaxID=378194 RepID=UPI002008B1FC|nr:LuxS/MPP-like metallohydrolase [Epithele typhae]KAH9941260.1 LuxS/MPP-like metallohydrolase [Epithele typhae]
MPSAWAPAPGLEPNLPPYEVFTAPIEKPEIDDREYRILRLQNGLRALLVHDPDADKAASSLCVAVGAFHDPDDAPGLAHFCEHLLTKGTEPYPEEGDYIAYVCAHGGSRNAATGGMSTDYWFAVAPDSLAGALAYQAAFFYAPLFTPELTKREVHAVDNEYRRNLQNDTRRMNQLTKHLSLPGHPFHQFGTGSYESLTESPRRTLPEGTDEERILLETRSRLVAWWEAQYCSRRMTLVIVGKDSLDALAACAVPLFSKIPDRGLDPAPAITAPVWGPEHKGTLVFAQTAKDVHKLALQFALPNLASYWESRPVSVLAHFLGHEGPGSACAYLKQRGWLLELTAGLSTGSHARGPQIFEIGCLLTVDGYLNYESVLATLFQHIAVLRAAQPLPDWHHAELQTMAATRFRFAQKAAPHRYAQALSRTGSQPYPPEHVLSGPHLFRTRDDAVLRRVLDGLAPREGRAFVWAPTHRAEVVGDDGLRTDGWATERWYGTRFAVRPLGAALRARLEAAIAPDARYLALPRPNPFIPSEEGLRVDKGPEGAEPAKYPTLIVRTAAARLWHKQDDRFWVPKADVYVVVKSRLAYASPRHAMLSRLLVDLVDDALAEVTYDASLADLAYALSNHTDGLVLHVSGYRDKLAVLLRTVLEKLRTLAVAPDRLRVAKEKIRREYENFYLQQPSNLSEQFARWAYEPVVWTPAEKVPELEFIGEKDVDGHRDALLSKVALEMLVNGDATREGALEYLSLAEDILRPRPLLPSEIPTRHALVLPEGSNFVFRKRHANKNETNNALSYYIQVGLEADARSRAIASLLCHLMHEPPFSTLRTKEQLGYVVAANRWSVAGATHGLLVKVQSPRPPWAVEARVDAFLAGFGDTLGAMAAPAFAAARAGLVAARRERAKNVAEEGARFWARVRAGDCDFVRADTDADAIGALTLADACAAYDALVHPARAAATRRKLSVQLVSQHTTEAPPAPAPGAEAEAAFKAGLGRTPAARVVVSRAFGEHEGAERALLEGGGPGSGVLGRFL